MVGRRGHCGQAMAWALAGVLVAIWIAAWAMVCSVAIIVAWAVAWLIAGAGVMALKYVLSWGLFLLRPSFG